MFARLIETISTATDSVPLLDEEFTADDFHPDVFELAALREMNGGSTWA